GSVVRVLNAVALHDALPICGCTLVRSHVNIQPRIGLLAAETLTAGAAEVAPDVELQIVGLVGGTITGDEGRAGRTLLASAVEARSEEHTSGLQSRDKLVCRL